MPRAAGVGEPDDLVGVDVAGGEGLVAGADPGERVALLGAGHGDHDERGAGDRRDR